MNTRLNGPLCAVFERWQAFGSSFEMGGLNNVKWFAAHAAIFSPRRRGDYSWSLRPVSSGLQMRHVRAQSAVGFALVSETAFKTGGVGMARRA